MEQTARPTPWNTALFAGSVAMIVAGLLLGFAILPRLFAPADAALVGKPAPDVPVRFVVNAPFREGAGPSTEATLASFKGRVVVLDFWATWCPPCRAELPLVNSLAARYRGGDVVVLGMNTSDEEGNARPYATTHGLSFPIAFDEGSTAARAFGVENLPTLVVVDKTGKIAAVRTGLTDADELDRLVQQAL